MSLSGQFTKCSFEGSNLFDAVLSGTFSSCTFQDAIISEGTRLTGTFIRCDFRGSPIRANMYPDAVFTDCIFDED